MRALAALVVLAALPAVAQDYTYAQRSRTNNAEIKLGGYTPMIDSESSLNGAHPWADTFGGPALLFELEMDRYLWQKYGAAGLGFSGGYAEKFGYAYAASGGGLSDVRTNFKSVPLRLLGLYRYDYLALNMHIPLVPYAKAGLVFNPWWSGKGNAAVDYVNGVRAAGGKWGLEFVAGIAFQLDVLEPRLAYDFYSDLGVAHTYLFADFTYAWVNDFGRAGLNLSSQHFMFGLSFEY